MIVRYLASTATGGRPSFPLSYGNRNSVLPPSPLSPWMQLCARAFQQKWICDFYDRDPIVLINGSAVHKFRPDISVSAGRWLIFRARHWFKLKLPNWNESRRADATRLEFSPTGRVEICFISFWNKKNEVLFLFFLIIGIKKIRETKPCRLRKKILVFIILLGKVKSEGVSNEHLRGASPIWSQKNLRLSRLWFGESFVFKTNEIVRNDISNPLTKASIGQLSNSSSPYFLRVDTPSRCIEERNFRASLCSKEKKKERERDRDRSS